MTRPRPRPPADPTGVRVVDDLPGRAPDERPGDLPDGLPGDLTVHARPIRVAIVDDHRLVLDGLATWLRAEAGDVEVVAAVPTWPDLLEHPAFPPDVVLLDLELGDDLPAAAKIVQLAAAGIAVVVMSVFGDPRHVREALTAGALGYVPKTEDAAEMSRALHAAARGEGHVNPALAAMLVADDDAAAPALSPQERRALVLYASGLPLKSVARQLAISVETAKTYLARVRDKYALAGREARTKIELHRRAVEDGLLTATTGEDPPAGPPVPRQAAATAPRAADPRAHDPRPTDPRSGGMPAGRAHA